MNRSPVSGLNWQPIEQMVLSALTLLLMLLLILPAPAEATPVSETLYEAARREGSFRVIITLRLPLQPQASSLPDDRPPLPEMIALISQEIDNQLKTTSSRVENHLTRVPLAVAQITEDGLALLDSSPYVKTVHREQILRPLSGPTMQPQLAQSSPTIQAPTLHGQGHTGSNRRVAILDTGIATHPAFGGRTRIVAEACFSSGDCPDGSDRMFGEGAAKPLIINGQPDSHGTHVAGIAAGQAVGSLNLNDGVAPAADIIGANVFHAGFFGPGAREMDVLDGLEWVLNLAADTAVDSVNLSLGGGRHNSPCDANFPAQKELFDQLLDAGVIPVAASGNDGLTNQVAWPACLSNVVAVGATSQGLFGGNEEIANFSNQNPQMTPLVAPGANIRAALPNNGAGDQSGTSMAAPHLAGGIALLRSALVEENPDHATLLQTLEETGEEVPDNRRNGQGPYKSIRLANAFEELAEEVPDSYILTINRLGSGEVLVNGETYVEPLTVYDGDTVTVEAIPEYSWSFHRWSGDRTDSDSLLQLLVEEDLNLTAEFKQHDTFLVEIDQQGEGEVLVDGQLYSQPLPVVANQPVEFQAVAEDYWYLAEWGGDLSGSDTVTTRTADTDLLITVIFEKHDTNILTVTIEGEGEVRIDGTSYSEPVTLIRGETVELRALPEQHWIFSNWQGDISGQDTAVQLPVDDDYHVTASFRRDSYTIELGINGEGTASINGETYLSPIEKPAGETLLLKAFPADYWSFTGWSGDITASGQTTTVYLEDDSLVTANFERDEFAGGSGTEQDPYKIADWYHLDSVRNHLDANFLLINNLDKTSMGYTELAGDTANNGEGWRPLGTAATAWWLPGNPFTGQFNGQHYQIADFIINRPNSNSIGLFGLMEGVITGVHVISGEVTGNDNSGLLTGRNRGEISQASAAGTVIGNERVGALVGDNWDGVISDCYATGTVEGVNMVGGLVGDNWGEVYRTYATATVSGQNNFGGLIGAENDATTVDSFWDLELSQQANSAGGEGLSSLDLKKLSTYLNAGWEITETDEDINDGYPYLAPTGATWRIPGKIFTLTVTIEGEGTVLVDGDSYISPVSFGEGDSLSLQAVAANDWRFAGWSGDINSDSTTQVVAADTDQSVTASFIEHDTCLLTVSLVGEGSVLVNNETYTTPLEIIQGETVELTALPEEFWEFTGWSGAGSGDKKSLTVQIDTDSHFIASFIQHETISLSIDIIGSGNVLVNSETYLAPRPLIKGDTVIIKAAPAEFWSFAEWQGDRVDSSVRLEFVADTNLQLTAVFTEHDTLTLTVIIEGEGTVLVDSKKYTEPLSVRKEDTITLSAIPDSHFSFTGWSQDLNSSSPVEQLYLDTDLTVTASFQRDTQLLEIIREGEGDVLVNGELYTDTRIIFSGDSLTLEANPAEFWSFERWENGFSSDSDKLLLHPDSNLTITVIFQPVKFLVRLAVDGPGQLLLNGDTYLEPQRIRGGETITIKAVETDLCYRFKQWTGNFTGTATYEELTVVDDFHSTAQFVPNFHAGEGSSVDPYQIENWYHLHSIRCFPEAKFDLIKQLDAADSGYAELAGPAAHSATGWLPVGDNSSPFAGVFSGNNHKIKDFQIDRTGHSSTGLFGETADSSIISDLKLRNFEIKGDTFTGAISGLNRGEINNSSALGEVSGGSGSGGLVGVNWRGQLNALYFHGKVEGTTMVGGVSGVNFEGKISNSYARGELTGSRKVGGITGRNLGGDLLNTYSTAAVQGTEYTGGISGKTEATWTGPPPTVVASFWDETASGISSSEGGEGKPTGAMQALATYLEAGWTIRGAAEDQNDSYPFLSESGDEWLIAVPELTLTIDIEGEGSVLINGETYLAPIKIDGGSSVTLEAVPGEDFFFDGWSGELLSADTKIALLVNRDKEFVARFRDSYRLDLSIIGEGRIEVDGLPVTGSVERTPGSQLLVEATPDSYWQFSGWEALPDTNPQRSIQLNSDTQLTALFEPIIYEFSAIFVGSGNLLVNGDSYSQPQQYQMGTELLLEAQPAPGWGFKGWSTGETVSQRQITILSDKTVLLEFAERIPLEIKLSGPTGVTIPRTGERNLTYQARTIDQFGETLNDSPSWRISGGDSTGISIDSQTGLVTVKDWAERTTIEITVESSLDSGVTSQQELLITGGEPGLSDLIVGPNPFRPGDGRPATGQNRLYFQFNSREPGPFLIEIYSLTGGLVYRATTTTVRYEWDLRNLSGDRVSGGYYLYRVVEQTGGAERTGKLAIVGSRR